ncbi:MAG: HD domain-containing protein [Lachnospiraceae bacterium]|nr:HD domain-containing protein [Lachnospiraceae bacterium]
MDRVNAILKNEQYRQIMDRIAELERDRIFCRHGIDHCLDVARIASLICLDEGYGISRDLIYAAALLHDIGRPQQYADGTAHEEAGAGLAPQILRQCGYDETECRIIADAVRLHGDEQVKDERNLSGLIYRADKSSRRCYMCPAIGMCHKKPEKRVMEIRY